MKIFIESAKKSGVILASLSLVLGIGYPLVVAGIGELFFRKEARGSLIHQDGKVIGSELIAQSFLGAGYFQPRPSAAGEHGYDAANSSGSNLGPTSQKLIETIRQRAEAYRLTNQVAADEKIPADAVTASASGLDPHISLKNARIQAKRIAQTRGIALEQVMSLIEQEKESPFLGLFGEERLNVLKANLLLNQKDQNK